MVRTLEMDEMARTGLKKAELEQQIACMSLRTAKDVRFAFFLLAEVMRQDACANKMFVTGAQHQIIQRLLTERFWKDCGKYGNVVRHKGDVVTLLRDSPPDSPVLDGMLGELLDAHKEKIPEGDAKDLVMLWVGSPLK